MLRGNIPAKVDEKGRLKIPAAFLEKLKEHGDRFYVTSEEGDHARIYPMKVWGEIEQKLANISSYNRAKQKFLTRTNYYGQVVEIDGQGRVLIPAVLREAAQMKGDVEVMGQLTYLEVWNHARFMTIQWLAIKPGGLYVDATVGLGGHAIEIVRRLGAGGQFVGLDRDAAALEIARGRLAEFGDKVTLVHANFSQIGEVFAERRLPPADGVLADLGVSSMQLDLSERGFSFRERGPLDMRMDRDMEETAGNIVNTAGEKTLADLLYQIGEERDSRRIARTIVRARPIRDTEHLATVVAGARKVRGRQKLHPATKTFLALRIAVNREMEELGQFLSRVPATLSQGGRWVMLSYHSLEDRPVKQCFQRLAREGTLKILTKKVIQASDAEIAANPRARSAKMRVAEKIDSDQHGEPQGKAWL